MTGCSSANVELCSQLESNFDHFCLVITIFFFIILSQQRQLLHKDQQAVEYLSILDAF